MPTNDKIKLIETLILHYKQMSAANDALENLLGCRVDSTALHPSWMAFDGYVSAVSQLVGDAGGEWLAWFIWENECGAKGMKAGYNNRLHPIKTVAQLVRLIEKGSK